ncbi:MAG: DUF3016 domain-containing protein [Pseudomonadota bacterium]
MKSLFLYISLLALAIAAMLPNDAIASDVLNEVNDELVVTESMEGALKINWEKPRSFSDVRRSNGNPNSKKYRHSVFKRIHGTFEDLVSTLPEGYSMRLNVTDLDLAGDTRTAGFALGLHRIGNSSSLHDVRVLRQIDVPRINFSYEIEDESGEVVLAESVNLKDLNYLQGASRINSSKPLFYEKRMLTRWFKREFKEVTQAPS